MSGVAGEARNAMTAAEDCHTTQMMYAERVNDNTLHIVDGESTGGTIKVSGLAGNKQILRWNDALYTGPVPAKLTLRQLSRLRSRFWTKGKSSIEFEQRDAALTKHADYEQTVLWFGSRCVLCQLSLIQLLSWFREHGVPARRLSWAALHGGELRPERIAGAYSSRQPITTAQMRLAERAWRAFRQTSPIGLIRLIKTDLSAISGLREALTRMLQEYPSKGNGLSRLEGLLLGEIRKRGSTKAAVAVGSIIMREPWGDTLLLDMLRAFVKAPNPLLKYAEPFGGDFKSYQFNRSVLKLSAVGQRVLSDKADAIALNGVDRWVGGGRLKGRRVHWRWDQGAKSIVAVKKR